MAAMTLEERLSIVEADLAELKLLLRANGVKPNDEPEGEFGPVTEEIPMDEATLAALKEARADYDAGRYCTSEELRAHIMTSLTPLEASEIKAQK